MSEKQTPATSSQLTSSAGDSPARISVAPERALAWTESVAGCGSNTCESFASYDPESSSLRTSQRCLLEGWTSYSEALPKAGMMQSGQLYELPTLALRTSEKGCSSWPTASATDDKTTSKPGQRRGQLADALWATPRHEGFDAGAHGGRPDSLHAQVKMWPTPDAGAFNDGQTIEAYQARKAREIAKGYNGNGGGTPLAMAVKLWPTPRNNTCPTDRVKILLSWERQKRHRQHARALAAGKLNADWVCQLMGFPDGWLDVGPPDPTSRRPTGKRRAPSKSRAPKEPSG